MQASSQTSRQAKAPAQQPPPRRRGRLRDPAMPGLAPADSPAASSPRPRRAGLLGGIALGDAAHPGRKGRSAGPRVTNFAARGLPSQAAALQRSEALLAEAERLGGTGSLSWCPATGEAAWSDGLRRILAAEPGEPACLELLRSRVHPEDVAAFDDMTGEARAGVGRVAGEFRLRLPDRSVRHLRMAAHRARSRTGAFEYVGAAQEVTDRRIAEEELSRAQAELAHLARVTSLGALTASIVHEVSQPLSGLITNAGTCLRMLTADPPDMAGAREATRRALRDGNRAAEVVMRLRAMFGRNGCEAEAVDLNEATREVIALSWTELRRSRVVLRPELAEDLPPVTGDRVQLQQVILNLLLNAAEAMSGVEDRPRALIVTTGRDGGDRVRLTVQDAGTGFGPEAAERLFQPFVTSKPGGMGMGLSVSRSIIERHRGRLWAMPNEGPGARFCFSLPCPAAG